VDAKAEVLRHLRAHLGEIAVRYSTHADGRPMRFEVLGFKDHPRRGATTFVTFGLCALELPVQNGFVREELVLATWDRFLVQDIPALLLMVAGTIADRQTAVIRGQVLGPRGPIFPGSTASALYFTPPPYFPESFDYLASTVPPTLFAGVVPLTREETEMVGELGWNRFEDEIGRQNPDLLDLARPSMTRLQ
jgi:hypothetical protein